MLIYLDIKIPHLKIAHLGGNLEVGNIKIHPTYGRDRYQQSAGPNSMQCHTLFIKRRQRNGIHHLEG